MKWSKFHFIVVEPSRIDCALFRMSQAEELDLLKKRRRTVRGLVTKLLTKIEEALEEEDIDSRKLQQLAIDLKEKRDKLKQLDENILERMYDADEIDEACNEEAGGVWRKSYVVMSYPL